uniref:Uncharacterized protein n=1 Tax=Eutreptiella gymnastica TaxID=73025 RepID=A0A7S4GGU3_9EUGL
MAVCMALEQTPSPSMQWANKASPKWAPAANTVQGRLEIYEPDACGVHEPYAHAVGYFQSPISMCHQPYTLPPSADQTWKEVWGSLSDRSRSVDMASSFESSIGSCNSQSDSQAEAITDEMTKCDSTAADIPGRFPVALRSRCTHRQHWERLRGKRGFSYFVCRVCGNGWRQPTKASKTAPTNAKAQSYYTQRSAAHDDI